MKITMIGAGSTIFAKNLIGDCILTPEIGEFEAALYDIDPVRLEDSRAMLENINRNLKGKAAVRAYTDRKEALRGADFVVNAIQVGGYRPSTVVDIEVPKKFGLKQTIGDTLGIGGIFRALRTIPVMEGIAADIEEVCPKALFLNYVNPMAMICGYMQRYTNVKTIGLCHSVQVCVPDLLRTLDMSDYLADCSWKIAGINHQAWLLSIFSGTGEDLYPEIKSRSASGRYPHKFGFSDLARDWDAVRHEMMHRIGYYITESSEHTSEYVPYFIKEKYPELLERFKIPIDEILFRYDLQEKEWAEMREQVVMDSELTHEYSMEYASGIIKAIITDKTYRIHGNVTNTGLIPNLPAEACVEVPCMVDRNGINPCYVGNLPEVCAALNRTNINVQLLTVEAALSRKKEDIYKAAMLDPHTSSELSIDDIRALCDALIEAHGDWLPKYH